MRILHAPTNIANQAWGISTQERALGHTSKVLVYTQNNPSYSCDENLHFERRSGPGKLLAATRALFQAIRSYDIIHFYFATSFFPKYIDLPLLHAMGKKLFFTFQGCDVRTDCFAETIDPVRHRHIRKDLQERNTRLLLRYAAHSYVLNPDLLTQVPTAEFSPYGSVQAVDWSFLPRRAQPNEPIVIFHSPSDRQVKGTPFIEAAIARLKSEGYNIVLDIAHDISWAEVKRKLQNAHLAIDQLRAGWYGASAVEMMASGKPTMCYLNPRDLGRVPDDFRTELPIINTTHMTIYKTLKALLDAPDSWTEISQKCRVFVEKFHNPKTIAERYLATYQAALHT